MAELPGMAEIRARVSAEVIALDLFDEETVGRRIEMRVQEKVAEMFECEPGEVEVVGGRFEGVDWTCDSVRVPAEYVKMNVTLKLDG